MYPGDYDNVEDPLDTEYRNILYAMKPYILHCNNAHYLEQYRLWLERLSVSSSAEKFERNKYLVELANQVHDGVLRPPFHFHPPRGPLLKLKKYQNRIAPPLVRQEQQEELIPCSESIQITIHKPRQSLPQTHKPLVQKIVHTPSPTQIKQNLMLKRKLSRNKARPSTQFSPSRMYNSVSETSSWCDLSESVTSVNTLARGDAGGKEEHKTSRTEEKVKEKEDSKKIEQEIMNKIHIEGDCSFLDPTEQEVEALKMRMKDLMEVKYALRATHCLTEDRKKTIENLHQKLTELEKENGELKLAIEKQTKKLVELDANKSKELEDYKQKFAELRNKELERSKLRHLEDIKCTEKEWQNKLLETQRECQQRIDALKKDFDAQLQKLLATHESTIRQKEEEIFRIKSEAKVREEINSANDQGCEIAHLKKCIFKLDKMLNRTEKDYVKQIQRLRQDLEIKEMTSQVQLQTQKADLIVRNSAAKQEELKYALNSLENKYKKMMDSVQNHALESKRRDEEVIRELKYILEKHQIIIEDEKNTVDCY